MIHFANPTFLWGFTGLLIPIAIHLLNRKEGKVIRFGSLRHIQETSTRQFRSLKINELILLALRCMLISWVVLLLSGASIITGADKTKWLLVEPGIESEEDMKPILDSLQAEGYQPRFFSPGFPEIGEKQPGITTDYALLLEELTARPTISAVVLSYNYASHFIGRRAALPSHITWIARIPAPHDFPISAVRMTSDSLSVRQGHSTSEESSFVNKKTIWPVHKKYFGDSRDSVFIIGRDTVQVLLAYDKDMEADKTVMSALLGTLRSSTTSVLVWNEIQANQALPKEKIDWLIWLSTSPPPNTGAGLIRYVPRPASPLFVRQRRDLYVVTKKLDQENVVDENLALDLLHALLPAAAAEKLAQNGDRRSMDERLALTTPGRETAVPVAAWTSSELLKALLVLILITLLSERALAYRRDQ